MLVFILGPNEENGNTVLLIFPKEKESKNQKKEKENRLTAAYHNYFWLNWKKRCRYSQLSQNASRNSMEYRRRFINRQTLRLIKKKKKPFRYKRKQAAFFFRILPFLGNQTGKRRKSRRRNRDHGKHIRVAQVYTNI